MDECEEKLNKKLIKDLERLLFLARNEQILSFCGTALTNLDKQPIVEMISIRMSMEEDGENDLATMCGLTAILHKDTLSHCRSLCPCDHEEQPPEPEGDRA